MTCWRSHLLLLVLLSEITWVYTQWLQISLRNNMWHHITLHFTSPNSDFCLARLSEAPAEAPLFPPAASLCLASAVAAAARRVCAHVRQTAAAVNVQVCSRADTSLVMLILRLSDSKVSRRVTWLHGLTASCQIQDLTKRIQRGVSSVCIYILYRNASWAPKSPKNLDLVWMRTKLLWD